MAFIKNLTEKLLEHEYRIIPNFYNSKSIGDDTEYIGFLKQSGAMLYGVVIINADKKYDCIGFCKDAVNNYFARLKKAIVVVLFVSEDPSGELLKFAEQDIEDYTEDIINIIWIADTSQKELMVKGSQPDKILELDKLINSSFDGGEYTAAQDITTLYAKTSDKRKAEIKSGNIYLTYALILINGFILAIDMMCDNLYGFSLSDGGALSRELVLSGEWYRLITHFFLHGGLMHFLANALSLYIFGGRTERYFGKLKMLIIYFLSGLGSGLLTVLCTSSAAVGASGAIFGLMAAVLVYTRLKKRSADGLDTYLLIIFAIIGILSGFMMPDVDNWGHIGGFITGMLTAFVIMKGENNGKVQ